VARSSCVNGSPEIELKTESGFVELHGAPGGTLDINLSFKPPEGFNPCTSLNGYRAEASYTLDEADGTRGTLTALRILGRAPNAENVAKKADGTPTTPSQNSATEKSGTGPSVETEGEVTDVNCTGTEMLLTLAVRSRQIKLHASNYARLIHYDDHPGPSNKGFLPCTQLKGRNVAVVYAAVEHRPYDGDIQSIEAKK
jgi:hypothetical protein